MGFIRRAFYSMKYRKWQNIILTIAYTLLFALTLGILLVYLSMSAQVDLLQKSLGCAVTLRSNVWDISLVGDLKYCSVREEDAQAFIDSPYVESYNKLGYIGVVAFDEDLIPYVRDSNRSLYERLMLEAEQGIYFGYMGDCLMIPVTQSEKFEAFTAFGFSLVEGRHFTAEDTDAVIISKELADRNGLKIGDQMSFTSNYYAQTDFYESEDEIQHVTLTICGLMDVPDAQEMGYDVDMFFNDPYNVVISAYEATKVLSNQYHPEVCLQDLTVYLRSADDMDAFIQETQEKLTIENVVGSASSYGGVTSDGGYIYSDETVVQERYDRFVGGDCFYTMYLDNEWYDMVAVPMESVRNLLGTFLVVVLVGSAVVLALVVILSLRGRQREFGILLAMGEQKRKVVGQIFVEVFVPLLAAAILGAILGTQVVVPLAENYSSNLLFVQSREEQTDLRAGMDNSDFWYVFDGGRLIRDTFRHHSYRTIAVVDSVPYKAGPEVYGAYFTLDFGMVVLILLIQMLSVLRVKPARILTRRE
ncbi:MAG: ABC transporter permease [Oscillibacter sp.]|nr:ABC transporter permease [Oscillibacter sp.]